MATVLLGAERAGEGNRKEGEGERNEKEKRKEAELLQCWRQEAHKRKGSELHQRGLE